MIRIFDNVLADPMAYRRAALKLEFKTYDFGHCVFHGIAAEGHCADLSVEPLQFITSRFPQLRPSLTFFRKSPLGQVEPHFIHTDVDMGQWSALLYLNPNPKDGDGTAFWTHKSGAIESEIPHERSEEGRTPDSWTMRELVRGTFNRVLMFPSAYFHSRAIHENWGDGDGARLVQVVFGTGVLQ